MLTPAEALSLVEAAEEHGFEHQSSRGPAYGEVTGFMFVCEPETLVPVLVALSYTGSVMYSWFAGALIVSPAHERQRQLCHDLMIMVMHRLCTCSPMLCFVQALRSNGRIAVNSPDFAIQLWHASSLGQHLQDRLTGKDRAAGLNPNIRIYRHGPPFMEPGSVTQTCCWQSPVICC